MTEPTKYFVVTKKAVPEVLLKVVEAKRLLESGKLPTIQDAVDAVGISRSSFYKYKDHIVAIYKANILTIHQSIPINGVAALSISVQVLQTTKDISEMLDAMEKRTGVHSVKILAKE